MTGTARNFFILAMINAVCGILLGLHMAITRDHGQMPTHAHVMVLGWLMSGFFAIFYHLFPQMGGSRLAIVHFWLTATSGIVLLISLFFLMAGHEAIEPLTAVSSLAFFAALLLFVWIALPIMRRTA
jgi:hypothetical protein